MDFKLGIDRQLDSFRAARREIEASVLPLATSVDGRRFDRGDVNRAGACAGHRGRADGGLLSGDESGGFSHL